jgi:hypothetical protein
MVAGGMGHRLAAGGVALCGREQQRAATGPLEPAVATNLSRGDHVLMLGGSFARIDDYEAPVGRVALSGYHSDALIGQYCWRLDGAQQLRVSLQSPIRLDMATPAASLLLLAAWEAVAAHRAFVLALDSARPSTPGVPGQRLRRHRRCTRLGR